MMNESKLSHALRFCYCCSRSHGLYGQVKGKAIVVESFGRIMEWK